MKENIREFFKKNDVAMSSAASWAWGTSLIMGQQIAQERGIVAWVIWAVCNSLTLAFFGYVFNKGVLKKEIIEKKEVKVIALIIQLFCLLVQLNFINNQFLIITGNELLSYLITIAIGLFFILIVFKKGLPTSIFTDIFQWGVAIVSIFVVIGIGLYCGVPSQTFVSTTSNGVLWGIWSGLVLFSGPIGDIQHWQRAEYDKTKKGYYKGAILFAIYMIQVLCMAFFKFNMAMNIVLLVAVLCVATSTIDSIAVALHEMGNKYVGTGFAIALCFLFGLFVKMGMIDLWSSFGIIRFAFAVAILLLPLCYAGKWKTSLLVNAVMLATVLFFSYCGQVKLLTTAGLISFAVVLLISVYLLIQTVKGAKNAKRKQSLKTN